ncbi:hypothetical protein Ccrd_017349, partial [Cynara cardunculus var. scolymus]
MVSNEVKQKASMELEIEAVSPMQTMAQDGIDFDANLSMDQPMQWEEVSSLGHKGITLGPKSTLGINFESRMDQGPVQKEMCGLDWELVKKQIAKNDYDAIVNAKGACSPKPMHCEHLPSLPWAMISRMYACKLINNRKSYGSGLGTEDDFSILNIGPHANKEESHGSQDNFHKAKPAISEFMGVDMDCPTSFPGVTVELILVLEIEKIGDLKKILGKTNEVPARETGSSVRVVAPLLPPHDRIMLSLKQYSPRMEATSNIQDFLKKKHLQLAAWHQWTSLQNLTFFSLK